MSGAPPRLLIQLSDPHITRPGEHLFDRIDTRGAFARALQRISTLDGTPSGVLITGDLCADGRPEEYAMLRQALAELPLPVHLVAGNHDHREHLAQAFPDIASRCPELPGKPLCYASDIDRYRLIVLDSSVPGVPYGALDPAQLDWLAQTLAAEPTRPTLIALHHPPFASLIAPLDRMGLQRGAAELESIVRRNPQIERVLCGHLHRSLTVAYAGTVAQCAPSTAHQMDLAFAPAADLQYVMEAPALLAHAWGAHGALVSHLVPIAQGEGPYAFG